MEKKQHVLILTNHFLPGYKGGGTIRSVAAMIERLNQYFDFSIITADRDLGENRPYPSVIIDSWIESMNYNIIYLSPAYLRIRRLMRLIKTFNNYDTVHLNSFFNYKFSILIILLKRIGVFQKKIIVCPHGEFNEGALAMKSVKKKIFIGMMKYSGVYRNVKWHATTDIEAKSIKRIFGINADVSIAEVLMNKKPLMSFPIVKIKRELKLIFMSRISPLKNLDFLLEMLLNLDLEPNDKLTLDIYGPPEDKNLLVRCKLIITELNRKNGFCVTYKGDLQYEKVHETITKYHFFILPSKGENFGYAIAESLMVGCPVIISDKTPWRDLAKEEIGWDLELEGSIFRECILYCLEMEDEHYQNMRRKAQDYAEKKGGNNEIIERYIELFF
ncbi:glycosyltransferase [Chitinophaga oryziterrae]|uniref:Glycosyltransferase n=1 Tax=Chitinophaga oryziterrae TaxID=1031224 RepID=A0A6N8JD91_9BACT|nr:glycosyltransferase [Chitinophaga oryziterrae]MVT42082.1 glycosyltransferase [Chitinophaga oryziterrae]